MTDFYAWLEAVPFAGWLGAVSTTGSLLYLAAYCWFTNVPEGTRRNLRTNVGAFAIIALSAWSYLAFRDYSTLSLALVLGALGVFGTMLPDICGMFRDVIQEGKEEHRKRRGR